MLLIVGALMVIGSVLVGYLMHGGHLMVLLSSSMYEGFHKSQQRHLLPYRSSRLRHPISSKMPWISEARANPQQDTRPF